MASETIESFPNYPARCKFCGNLLILLEYLPNIEEKYYCIWCHTYHTFKVE